MTVQSRMSMASHCDDASDPPHKAIPPHRLKPGSRRQSISSDHFCLWWRGVFVDEPMEGLAIRPINDLQTDLAPTLHKNTNDTFMSSVIADPKSMPAPYSAGPCFIAFDCTAQRSSVNLDHRALNLRYEAVCRHAKMPIIRLEDNFVGIK
jgi:hypothetical protein